MTTTPTLDPTLDPALVETPPLAEVGLQPTDPEATPHLLRRVLQDRDALIGEIVEGADRCAQIAGHFVKGFIRIAIIANIVAWPLSFAFTRLALQKIDYPYPFSMGVTIFLIAGVLTLLLTIGTVSVQTFRAASVNPVNALRDE